MGQLETSSPGTNKRRVTSALQEPQTWLRRHPPSSTHSDFDPSAAREHRFIAGEFAKALATFQGPSGGGWFLPRWHLRRRVGYGHLGSAP